MELYLDSVQPYELLMGSTGRFNETIEKRIQFKGLFAEYFETRQKVTTRVFMAS